VGEYARLTLAEEHSVKVNNPNCEIKKISIVEMILFPLSA
jgi:hypothetical protein